MQRIPSRHRLLPYSLGRLARNVLFAVAGTVAVGLMAPEPSSRRASEGLPVLAGGAAVIPTIATAMDTTSVRFEPTDVAEPSVEVVIGATPAVPGPSSHLASILARFSLTTGARIPPRVRDHLLAMKQALVDEDSLTYRLLEQRLIARVEGARGERADRLVHLIAFWCDAVVGKDAVLASLSGALLTTGDEETLRALHNLLVLRQEKASEGRLRGTDVIAGVLHDEGEIEGKLRVLSLLQPEDLDDGDLRALVRGIALGMGPYDRALREAALTAELKAPDAESAGFLLEVLEVDLDEDFRRVAVRALAATRAEEATSTLLAILHHDPDVGARRFAAEGLGDLDSSDTVVDSLRMAYREQTDVYVRSNALESLGRHAGHPAAAAELAWVVGNDPVALFRATATLALAQADRTDLVELLHAVAANDPDEETRENARIVLEIWSRG